MGKSCRDCEEGPRGIAGHDGLALVPEKPRPGEAVLFKCAACGAAWLRTYDGGGNFRWSPFEGARATGTN